MPRQLNFSLIVFRSCFLLRGECFYKWYIFWYDHVVSCNITHLFTSTLGREFLVSNDHPFPTQKQPGQSHWKTNQKVRYMECHLLDVHFLAFSCCFFICFLNFMLLFLTFSKLFCFFHINRLSVTLALFEW